MVFEADEQFILMDRMPVDGGPMEREVAELMEAGRPWPLRSCMLRMGKTTYHCSSSLDMEQQ